MDDILIEAERLVAPHGGRLVLEARDPAHNIARSWRIETGGDLFGWFVVSWRWGRIGAAGQTKALAFANPAEALPFIRRLLRRRLGAEGRIGVAYRLAG